MTHQKHKQSKRNDGATRAATDDTVTIGSQSFEALWAQVEERVKVPTYEELAAKGYRTTKELCDQFALGEMATVRILGEMTKRGEMERVECLIFKRRGFMWRPMARKVFVPSGK